MLDSLTLVRSRLSSHSLDRADSPTSLAEEGIFDDSIVFAKITRYQPTLNSRSGVGVTFFLCGNLQFSSSFFVAQSLAERKQLPLRSSLGNTIPLRDLNQLQWLNH